MGGAKLLVYIITRVSGPLWWITLLRVRLNYHRVTPTPSSFLLFHVTQIRTSWDFHLQAPCKNKTRHIHYNININLRYNNIRGCFRLCFSHFSHGITNIAAHFSTSLLLKMTVNIYDHRSGGTRKQQTYLNKRVRVDNNYTVLV